MSEEQLSRKERPTKKIFLISFWLSLLIHLLVLILFATILIKPKSEDEKSPQLYQVPSYVYTGKVAAPKPSPSEVTKQEKPVEAAVKSPELPLLKTKEARAIPALQKKEKEERQAEKAQADLRSILAVTHAVLQQNQRKALQASYDRNNEPIYMIGEENAVTDPLIRMIGKALSAHFEYPRLAGEYGITGRTLIGFTLHPEGTFSDIEIIKTSYSEDLDAAALYAVNNAPTIEGADRLLKEPKHFVVGFIFRQQMGY